MSTASDVAVTTNLLSDPRLERLLTIGKEINDLRFKITTATTYLLKGGKAEELEAVEMARTQLARDLSKELAEAKELMPTLDEIAFQLQEREKGLQNVRKMSIGLAKIEGLSGTNKQKEFTKAAAPTEARIAEIENLISTLDALQNDLVSTKKSPHACPRCSSARISYRITHSDLGYTLYRCDECGNAWKITQFSFPAT